MSSPAVIAAVVVIVAILIVAAWFVSTRQRSGQKQRSQTLREQFGTEYDRTVAEKGNTRRAEKELTARQKRVAKLHIRPLAGDEGQHFSDEWQVVQARFVDDPSASVGDADALVGRVMDARGYPEGDFERRFADVSVDHPTALEDYRAAHEIELRNAHGEANTEDLRQAEVKLHALFTELIQEPAAIDKEPAAIDKEPAAIDKEPVAIDIVPDSEVADTEVPVAAAARK